MQGIIELSNGKVDLTYNGAIYTDAVFKASNVLFYASDLWEAEGSEVWIWNNIARLEKCNFVHVDFHAQTGKCHFMGCDFQGPNAGFEAFDGAFLMEGCLFNAADCRSSELGASSIIRNSRFEYDAEVVDFSNQDLMIHECEFYHTMAAPIEKTSGRIILGCSHFAHCAALQFTACTVDISALQGGGRNAFESVNRCIQLAEINELLLDEGRNDFSGCENLIMEGSIDTSCSALNCSLQLNAIHNHWGADVNGLSNVNGLLPPPSNKIHVYASSTPVCGGFEQGAMCEIECIDDDPILPERCISPLKSVSTATDEQLLQHSLRDIFNGPFTGFAQMEVYDLQGKLVLNSVVSSYNDALVKLNELGASMYSIVVRNSDSYLTTKWMVFE
jgi:hypothetical protein